MDQRTAILIRESNRGGHRPCVSLNGATRAVSGGSGTLLGQNIAENRNFSAQPCATIAIFLGQQRISVHKNCGLHQILRTALHCWSKGCRRGAMYVRGECAGSAICTDRCVRAVTNTLRLHSGGA